MTMDFQSAMETFAEAWVAANSKVTPVPDTSTQTQALALTRHCKTPPPPVSTPAATGSSSRDSVERGGSTPPPPRSLTPLDSMVSPPSVKEEIDNIKSTGKSLPVHCIVEAVCTLDEKRILQQMPWRRRTAIETDSYVIIPVGTPFHNIVYTALLRLGYSADSAAAARGSLVIKNWKALTFDQITEDPLVTVGDILGELTTVATLRIQVFRGRPSVYAEIKDKLLRFLLMQSHNLLASTGCPLDELTISYLYRGTNNIHVPEVSEECRRKFDQWWSAQLNPQSPGRSQVPPQCTTTYTGASQTSKNIDRVLTDPTHPAMQTVHSQFPAQKTRMRTSFDPELELPKLQRWFADNQHPSRQQIQQYVRELNSLESRRGRKPLDVNNVVYWFKNARAAQKRAEVRNLTPGLSCHIGMNGYGGHSPSNGSSFLMSDSYLNSERLNEHRLKNNINLCRRPPHIGHLSDEFSNAGSEIDDDDMVDIQPSSPTGPLSLTTSRKDESHNGSPQTSPINPLNIKTETKDDAKCDDDGDSHRINNNNKTMNGSDVEEDEPDNEAETKSNFDVVDQAPSFRPISQRLSISPDMESQMLSRPPSSGGLERLAASFPLVPNSMFSHSIMYMSQYIPGLSHTTASPTGSAALGMSALTADERRKRNRTFIDPVTEVPRLEQWFSLNTHPSHNLILKYTEELNCMAYRQKFPRLEPKNVQFWFKNRRAKCKRLKMSLFDNQASGPYHHGDKE